MRFGEIFSKSWQEYKKNFKVFSIIFILLSVIPSIIAFFISIPFTLEYSKLGAQPSFSEIIAVLLTSKFLISIIAGIVVFLISLLMSASFIYNVFYRKKEMSVRETLAGGKKYFWKFFGFSIVYYLFLTGLFLLLIIPGIIFLIFWIFASYIFIGENKGILESLKNSRRIVEGRWWKTFGWLLLFGLIAAGIGFCFSIVAGIINIPIANNTIPAYIIVARLVKQVFSLGASLITAPLGILFFKNFYLDMKASAGKKKK